MAVVKAVNEAFAKKEKLEDFGEGREVTEYDDALSGS